jgi:crotonobetainyl-CoA:carnitine CoA-transferase CaiB-like acyl-CoA transferase
VSDPGNLSPAALAGLRVVDLTDLRGALAGRMLAELGADVVKVEPPSGDPGRLRPPFAGNQAAPDRSLPFLYRNAGKRGVVIDLDGEGGRERFAKLCDQADVLIENLGPIEQSRRRLTPDAVRARHPHLVHLTISDFGLSGPRATWRLEPLTAFAACGALHASGFADRPPCWLPGYVAHDCASIFGVVGVLTALLERSRSGRGQTVEVSVQEAALNGLDPWSIPLGDYAHKYPMLPTSAPRDADGVYIVLATRDGYVRAVLGSMRHLTGFARLLLGGGTEHAPEHVSESRGRPRETGGIARLAEMWLESLPARALHLASGVVIGVSRIVPLPGLTLSVTHGLLAAARALGDRALETRPRAEVLDLALHAGVPMAAVNTPEEFVAAGQTQARGYFQSTGFPHLGDAPFASAPWRLSATPAVLRRAAPAPGEDDPSGFPERPPAAPTVRGGRPDQPISAPVLAGYRVINLGVAAVGPELCWLLGELGAEVIKIESESHLDLLRRATPELDNPNTSFPFNDAGRGQKSVCLDLRNPRARELALRLCAAADVVVENHRGGVMRALGLDYADVKRLRPDVIYVASQGYGRGGPLGVVAVLAAHMHRLRTGEGQLIDMAQTEATAYLMGEFYLERPLTGRPTRQKGNAVDYACPHGVYPCAGEDLWCAIAVVGDEAWERFCTAVGWLKEPRLATLAGRLVACAELDSRVAEWTRTRSPEAAASTLQSAGVSAMPVQGPDEHRADSHLAARGALVTVVHPDVGAARYTANPLRMSETRMAPVTPAPRLGEHTADVLTRVLGLGEEEVRELVSQGVCR